MHSVHFAWHSRDLSLLASLVRLPSNTSELLALPEALSWTARREFHYSGTAWQKHFLPLCHSRRNGSGILRRGYASEAAATSTEIEEESQRSNELAAEIAGRSQSKDTQRAFGLKLRGTSRPPKPSPSDPAIQVGRSTGGFTSNFETSAAKPLPPHQNLSPELRPRAYGERPILRRPPDTKALQWQRQKVALEQKFPEGWNPKKKLSPDAQDGIRSLHEHDPETYNTEMLAQRFEVSPEAVRRILKSTFRPTEKEAEDRRRRWEKRGERVWEGMREMGLRDKTWEQRKVKIEKREQQEMEAAFERALRDKPTSSPAQEEFLNNNPNLDRAVRTAQNSAGHIGEEKRRPRFNIPKQRQQYPESSLELSETSATTAPEDYRGIRNTESDRAVTAPKGKRDKITKATALRPEPKTSSKKQVNENRLKENRQKKLARDTRALNVIPKPIVEHQDRGSSVPVLVRSPVEQLIGKAIYSSNLDSQDKIKSFKINLRKVLTSLAALQEQNKLIHMKESSDQQELSNQGDLEAHARTIVANLRASTGRLYDGKSAWRHMVRDLVAAKTARKKGEPPGENYHTITKFLSDQKRKANIALRFLPEDDDPRSPAEWRDVVRELEEAREQRLEEIRAKQERRGKYGKASSEPSSPDRQEKKRGTKNSAPSQVKMIETNAQAPWMRRGKIGSKNQQRERAQRVEEPKPQKEKQGKVKKTWQERVAKKKMKKRIEDRGKAMMKAKRAAIDGW
ncbi:MAG: hypothetical protein Q9227_008508 [Pyrenula ochraceoflavens]